MIDTPDHDQRNQPVNLTQQLFKNVSLSTNCWLDSRRLPLKKELIGLWESRIESTATGYAVCVDGKKRVYQANRNRWIRLDDLPYDCPRVEFKSLQPDIVKD